MKVEPILALAELVGGRAADADGQVRLVVDAGTWTALAAGCVEGYHDLVSLWADGDAVRLALSDAQVAASFAAGQNTVVPEPATFIGASAVIFASVALQFVRRRFRHHPTGEGQQ